MSKSQTSHEPSPDDGVHGPAGRDGHRPGDVADEPHGVADHGEDHGHDDHAHGSEALGPVDVRAWAALGVGVAAGLLVAVCLVITRMLAPVAA